MCLYVCIHYLYIYIYSIERERDMFVPPAPSPAVPAAPPAFALSGLATGTERYARSILWVALLV